MGKKIPYSDEIKEILGEEISDKNIQEVGKNMTRLYKKALPKEEFKSGLLSRLRNVHDIRLSGPDMISQKISFYRYLGIALSFVCIAGGIMAFKNARELDLRDVQKTMSSRQADMIAFPQAPDFLDIDEKETEGDTMKEADTKDKNIMETTSTDIEAEISVQQKTRIQKSGGKVGNETKQKQENVKQVEPVNTPVEADLQVQNIQDDTSGNTGEKQESSDEVFHYDASIEENITIPELSDDADEASFEMNAHEDMMMGTSMMRESYTPTAPAAGGLQKFTEICQSYSGSILADGFTCVLPDEKTCTLENIFPDSPKPCDALYTTENSTENK